MNRTLKHLLLFVFFLLFQILVLNDLGFWYAVPLLYVYAMLLWPSDMAVWQQLLAAFLLGIFIDIASDTPGMHAFAATFAAYLRLPLLRSFGNPDNGVFEPGERTMGFLPFWKYALCMVLIHHSVLFLIESFSLFNPLILLFRTVSSTLLTLLLILLLERFRAKS